MFTIRAVGWANEALDQRELGVWFYDGAVSGALSAFDICYKQKSD